MNIKILENGTETTVIVDGRIDTVTAPSLDSELDNVYSKAQSLVLDLANVPYTSSAGLRVFLKAHKSMAGKGGFVLRNVCPEVMEVFEATGFSDFLNIEQA